MTTDENSKDRTAAEHRIEMLSAARSFAWALRREEDDAKKLVETLRKLSMDDEEHAPVPSGKVIDPAAFQAAKEHVEHAVAQFTAARRDFAIVLEMLES